MWNNSPTRYGIIARLLHWSMAVIIVTLITLGLWMTDLTYYDPWYRKAPLLHEGLGVIAFILLLLRLIYRWYDPPPPLTKNLKPWERLAAQITHNSLYLLMAIIPMSGYFITTAKGLPVEIFGWISIPALFNKIPHMEDSAGNIHLFLGLTLASLVLIHLAAGLKHHFIDKDTTLLKMLSLTNQTIHPNQEQ